MRDVNWYLVVGIFLAKAILFIVIVIMTLILSKPSDLRRAGLYGIFCTQSNDFAVGFPLLISLYSTSHPFFPKYVYLLAPVQLLMINPFGVVMMEVQKHWSETKSDKNFFTSWLSFFTAVIKGIFRNPIVLMTALGVLWCILFNHWLPPIMA